MAEVNVTAFGTIFKAVGAKLNYNSERVQLEVIETPKSKEKIIEAAIKDISHFCETANYVDGTAALVLAETIDGSPNPLNAKIRKSVLEGLAITKGGRFIYQTMSLAKSNKSWHESTKPCECVFFGDVCVNRGIHPDPNRKGRRSYRQPSAFHTLDGRGIIRREQLVTQNVERLFQAIPKDSFVSGRESMSIGINLKSLTKMSVDEKLRVISHLQESLST